MPRAHVEVTAPSPECHGLRGGTQSGAGADFPLRNAHSLKKPKIFSLFCDKENFARNTPPMTKTLLSLSLTAVLALGGVVNSAEAAAWKFGPENKGITWDSVRQNPIRPDGFAGYNFPLNGVVWDQGTDAEEGKMRWYAGSAFAANKQLSAIRTRENLPTLRQNWQLSYAAQLLVYEMYRQGWAGVNFPDGKNIAWALNQPVSRVLHCRLHRAGGNLRGRGRPPGRDQLPLGVRELFGQPGALLPEPGKRVV